MMTEKKTDNNQLSQKPRANDKYFNYRKKRYYAQNCRLRIFKRKPKDEMATKKLNKLDREETKQAKKLFLFDKLAKITTTLILSSTPQAGLL